MNRVRSSKGFTLIELMLAMAFISILLLAIATTIIQIGKMYNKGMALKEINQSSRMIGDDLTRAFVNAASFDRDTDYVELYQTPTLLTGGRLCIDKTTYVWNTARAIEYGYSDVTKYAGKADTINFLRITDPSAKYCKKNTTTGKLLYPDILASDAALAKELLPPGDFSMSMGRLSLPVSTASDESTGETLYTVSYGIAFGKSDALRDDLSQCKTPNEAGADNDFCSLQNFTIVVRGSGR